MQISKLLVVCQNLEDSLGFTYFRLKINRISHEIKVHKHILWFALRFNVILKSVLYKSILKKIMVSAEVTL